ncbi:head-tail connector protein [Pleomorphomonas koreensis]|uniref:head-tail connector protein n=1 Tax=Pleomorphomonas koreensis TaxID=257440 RepID=UPI00041418BD|nr:head-tail connector protein [Pleomorphomonas koreensis]
MAVAIIEKPLPLITWEEAKQHLRIDSDDEQTSVEGMIAAATQHVDGPEGWLGRSLMAQTLELRLDCWPYRYGIALPYPPVIEIEGLAYDDANGLPQEMAPEDYRLTGAGACWRLWPAFGKGWPAIRADHEVVRVRYRAGYPSAEDVPAPIRAAILLMVGDLYANRETASMGAAASEIPMSTTVEALLTPYRVWL